MLQADQIYRRAQTCEIWDQSVEHAGARAFVLAAYRLVRGLGDLVVSQLWQDCVALVRRCQWLVCTVPLPFDAPELGLEAFASQLAATSAYLDGIAEDQHTLLLAKAAEALGRLVGDSCDPLGACARDFLALEEDTREGIVVLRDRRFAEPVRASMARNGVAVQVSPLSALSGPTVFTAAAVVGPPALVPGGVLNAPRANDIALVHYAFFREEGQVLPLLPDPASRAGVLRPISISRPFQCGDPLPPAAFPPGHQEAELLTLPSRELVPDDEIQAVLGDGASVRQGEQSDRVEAIVAVLADGSQAFLPESGDARILTLDTARWPTARVEQATASSVEPGDYLALRDSSHYQDLLRRADALLGADAPALRADQAAWKQQLRQRAEGHLRGSRGVADELRRRGAVTANVPYWISDWCIRPRSRDDFAVVLGYLGRGAEADILWERLALIDRAHRSAGQRFAADLQRALTPDLLRQLTSVGWCDAYPVGCDSATLVARVESILPGTRWVPFNALCRLRPTEDF